MKKPVYAAALLLSALLAPPVAADECVKRVFQHFCLGGPRSALPAAAQPPEHSSVWRATLQGASYQLELEQQRLVRVTRYIAPGDWLLFKDWKAKLNRVYGSSREIESLPPFASSRSSRRNAIISGRGRLHLQWPQSGWHISLLWDSIEHLQLIYQLAPDTDAQDNPEGL